MSDDGRPLRTGLPSRTFGGTGIEVSITGLGGEGILRTHGQDGAARTVIREAIDQSITYFDCAHAYAGSEGYYGLVWPNQPEDRARAFQASKSAERTRRGALAELDQTLRNMGIDHPDLWQIHDLRTEEDFRTISGPGGWLFTEVCFEHTGRLWALGADRTQGAISRTPITYTVYSLNV
jgi:aryl-alcohol dehydrogenase-like predicted oxidoreductase